MYSVIVIDDEYLMRSAVSDYIKSQLPDFEVCAAFADGTEALEYLSGHSVDVIVTDIRMFQTSGLDIAEYAHSHCPGTAVIIISGYSDFEYAQKSIRYGVKNYILKPIDFDELSKCFAEIGAELALRQPAENSASSDSGGLFLIYAFSGIFEDEQELRRLARKELPFSVDSTPILIISVSVDGSFDRKKYNQEKLSPLIEKQLSSVLPDTSAYFLWGRGFRFFFVLTCPELDTAAVSRSFRGGTGLTVSVQVLYQADSVLKMAKQLPDKWFGHCMHEALAGTARQSASATIRQNARKDLLVEQAKEYIQNHYMEDISREDVAAAVFISHSYLSHIFTEITGMTYIEYLTRLRMEKAIELLRQNKKINEVARLVGYRSRKPFLANFREYTSCSPSEYLLKHPQPEKAPSPPPRQSE